MYYTVGYSYLPPRASDAKSSKYRLMYYRAYYAPGSIKHLPDSFESEICK